ncbi:hypothetical protein [Actinoplanes auranticolor]|uniref:LPXTG-motif cell wall-anchored protein n=1 Tax=Actinoplanes auranticolor TaxID=47988 RepID=A0A919S5R3_9ACTN|nr:hypothetical protein [Actinoplanes auranticolor]GIM65740.1 hypothetical protein Aau02nite_19370 [Actinoplanes auranticolor]
MKSHVCPVLRDQSAKACCWPNPRTDPGKKFWDENQLTDGQVYIYTMGGVDFSSGAAKPPADDDSADPQAGGQGGDDDGGLPITGDSVPVPALLALALALIVAGAALAWWARRRRTFVS